MTELSPKGRKHITPSTVQTLLTMPSSISLFKYLRISRRLMVKSSWRLNGRLRSLSTRRRDMTATLVLCIIIHLVLCIIVLFIEKYKLVKGKLVHQSPYIVPRAFPNYSSNPKGKVYSSYCKYQLLKYKPWANNPNNAWDSEQPCDQTYIDAWHDFLTSREAALHVPNWEEKLHNAMKNAKKEQSEDTDMVENDTH